MTDLDNELRSFLRNYLYKIKLEDFGYIELDSYPYENVPFISLIVPLEMVEDFIRLKKKYNLKKNLWESTALYSKLRNFLVRGKYKNTMLESILSSLETFTKESFNRVLNSDEVRMVVTGEKQFEEEGDYIQETVILELLYPKRCKNFSKLPIKRTYEEVQKPLIDAFFNHKLGCYEIIVHAPQLSEEEAKSIEVKKDGRIVFPRVYQEQKVPIPPKFCEVNKIYKNGTLIIRIV